VATAPCWQPGVEEHNSLFKMLLVLLLLLLPLLP